MRLTLLFLFGSASLLGVVVLSGGGLFLWFRAANAGAWRSLLNALLILLACAALVAGCVSLVAGSYLLWFNFVARDSDGYLSTGVFHFEEAKASVLGADPDEVEIDLVGRLADRLSTKWFDPARFVARRLKGKNVVTVRNKDPSKEVFVGTASDSDVEAYVAETTYYHVLRVDLNPLDDHVSSLRYSHHRGRSGPTPPSTLSFWEDSTIGSGFQTFTWNSDQRSQTIVIMNGDASRGLDVEFTLGTKADHVYLLNIVILLSAVTMLAGGAILAYKTVLARNLLGGAA